MTWHSFPGCGPWPIAVRGQSLARPINVYCVISFLSIAFVMHVEELEEEGSK